MPDAASLVDGVAISYPSPHQSGILISAPQKNETQGGQRICPRSHKKEAAGLGLGPRPV